MDLELVLCMWWTWERPIACIPCFSEVAKKEITGLGKENYYGTKNGSRHKLIPNAQWYARDWLVTWVYRVVGPCPSWGALVNKVVSLPRYSLPVRNTMKFGDNNYLQHITRDRMMSQVFDYMYIELDCMAYFSQIILRCGITLGVPILVHFYFAHLIISLYISEQKTLEWLLVWAR